MKEPSSQITKSNQLHIIKKHRTGDDDVLQNSEIFGTLPSNDGSDDSEDIDMNDEGLPSLFPTPSMGELAPIKSEIRRTPQQPNPNQYQAQSIVAQIAQLEEHQRQQIDKMQQLQQQLCLNPQSADITQLQEQQFNLNQQIELELKELRQVNRIALLAPTELHLSRILGQRLLIQQQLLDLYRKELSHLINPNSNEP